MGRCLDEERALEPQSDGGGWCPSKFEADSANSKFSNITSGETAVIRDTVKGGGRMDVARLTVILYMQTQVLIGSICQRHEQRLLDLFNGALLSPSENSGMFLKLSDVTISHADGKKGKLPSAYINKATIQIVATPETNSARGIGAKVGLKPYPFVLKSPAQVSLRMPSYVLIGSMHCASEQGVWKVLEEKLMFLPVTDVKIRSITNRIWWRALFVAVNREQILSLQEEEIAQVHRHPSESHE